MNDEWDDAARERYAAWQALQHAKRRPIVVRKVRVVRVAAKRRRRRTIVIDVEQFLIYGIIWMLLQYGLMAVALFVVVVL